MWKLSFISYHIIYECFIYILLIILKYMYIIFSNKDTNVFISFYIKIKYNIHLWETIIYSSRKCLIRVTTY